MEPNEALLKELGYSKEFIKIILEQMSYDNNLIESTSGFIDSFQENVESSSLIIEKSSVPLVNKLIYNEV
jgi:hypothetical protein